MIDANDDLATTPAAAPVTVNILANDTKNGVPPVALPDLQGLPTITLPPSNGTATVNPDGTVTYTPNPGFCGTDTFEYEITEAPNVLTFVAGPGQLRVAAPQGSIVNWGDGSPLETTGSGAGELQHTYATAGPHVGTIEQQPGVFNRHIGGEALLEVVRWGAEPLLGSFSFYGNGPSPNLTAVPSTAPPGVTDMANMFRNAASFNQPIGGWDVSNVTNMSYMFRNAASFNQPLNGWDTSSVTNMASMFYGATSFDQPIGGWDVSNVTDMSYMFFGTSSFNQPIGGWDVSNATNMSYMFRSTVFNQDISGWDVSSATDMSYMFNGASSFNQDLSSWCVENIASAPTGFSTNTPAWTLPKPNWGAPC